MAAVNVNVRKIDNKQIIIHHNKISSIIALLCSLYHANVIKLLLIYI